MSNEATQTTEDAVDGTTEDINTDSLISDSSAEENVSDSSDAATTDESNSEDNSSDDDSPKIWANKFKTAEDLEKGYKEAVQKLREKTPEAPENYEINLDDDEDLAQHSDLIEGIDVAGDPRFQEMEGVFKKHNLSNDAVQDIVKAQMLIDIANLPDLDAEAKALGSDSDLMIARANNFVGKHLDEEGRSMATEIGKTAAGVRFLDKMAQMVGEKSIPTEVKNDGPDISSKELYNEAFAFKNGTQNFEANEAARNKYDQLLEKAIKAEQKEAGQ